MRHHHDRANTQEKRRLVAAEAARLMAEDGIRDYFQAKHKAAQRLGIWDDASLPRNAEIERALREHLRVFHADSQPQILRHKRQVALDAMEFLSAWNPRLVGAVLEGTADEHSAVSLHVFADPAEVVSMHLSEHGIPYDEQSRRLRLTRECWGEFPVLLFQADGVPIDITVLPEDLIRQAPLSRIDEKPMQRASRHSLEALIRQSESEPEPQAV